MAGGGAIPGEETAALRQDREDEQPRRARER